MAKEPNKPERPAEQTDQAASPSKKTRIVTGSIVGGIILVFAAAGFFLGLLLVDMRPKPIVMAGVPDPSGSNGVSPSLAADQQPDTPKNTPEKTWFYEMKPVLANLNDPGAMRYVRATLTLQMLNTLDEEKGRLLLEEKERTLRDYLTIYLAGLSLDDVRGDKNLIRIQAQVLEAFNQELFPNAKPHIDRILLQEFAIQ